jgi:hypothetical protein
MRKSDGESVQVFNDLLAIGHLQCPSPMDSEMNPFWIHPSYRSNAGVINRMMRGRCGFETGCRLFGTFNDPLPVAKSGKHSTRLKFRRLNIYKLAQMIIAQNHGKGGSCSFALKFSALFIPDGQTVFLHLVGFNIPPMMARILDCTPLITFR